MDSDGWRIALGLGLVGLGIIIGRVGSNNLVTIPPPTMLDMVALASVTGLSLAGVAIMFMPLFRKALDFLTKRFEK